MALDRFIYWNKEKPTIDQVRQLLKDYISDAAKIEEKNDWFFITLPGNGCLNQFIQAQSEAWTHNERWFEVCCIEIDNNIDIMTRQSDHFTNAVAECFAKSIAKFYHARYEDASETTNYGE